MEVLSLTMQTTLCLAPYQWYIYIYIYMYIYIHTYIYIYVHVYIYIYVYVYTYRCGDMSTEALCSTMQTTLCPAQYPPLSALFNGRSKWIYVHMYVFKYIWKYVYIHIYIYIYIYMYIYVCIDIDPFITLLILPFGYCSISSTVRTVQWTK
jgi:cytochrome P450 family 4